MLSKSKIGAAINRFWNTKIHFLELHYFYILFSIFIISGLYYCQPGTNWNYIDSLFMATTGITNTGLNTITISDMSTYQMLVLFFSTFMGHHALISFFVVMVRRYYFSKRFEDVLIENQKRKEEYKLKKFQKQQENSKMLGPIRRRMSLISIRSTPVQNSAQFSIFSKDRRSSFGTQATKNSEEKPKEYSSIQMDANSNQNEDEQAHSSRRTSGISPFDRDTAADDSTNKNGNSSHISSSNKSTNSSISLDKDKQNNASTTPNAQQITFREDTNILRERERKKFQQQVHQGENNSIPIYRTNSESEIMDRPVAKSQLTRHERYRMGGTEYCALDMLAWLIPIYYLGFVIVFGFMFRIYVACSTYAQAVLETSNPNGPVEPWFFSFFLSLSAFTNLGLNNLDASMVPFQNAPCPLILCIILILVGNTAFAIMLRFIIWACYRLAPKSKELTKETFRYLLDHPRRCYTTLFPSTQTWWLLIVLIIITLIELVSFLALNYWLPVLSDISWGSRFLDGLFQSVATRNGIDNSNYF